MPRLVDPKSHVLPAIRLVGSLAVGLILAAAFLPQLPLDVPFYWTIGTLFVATGLLFAFRSYSELKS